MKKRIIILCLLLLGGAIKVQAMTPEVKLIAAVRFLKSREDGLQRLLEQPAVRDYTAMFEEAEQEFNTAQKSHQELRQGADSTRVLQDVEYAEGRLTDLKNDPLYQKYQDRLRLEESIAEAREDIENLQAQLQQHEVQAAEEREERAEPPEPAPPVSAPPAPVAEPAPLPSLVIQPAQPSSVFLESFSIYVQGPRGLRYGVSLVEGAKVKDVKKSLLRSFHPYYFSCSEIRITWRGRELDDEEVFPLQDVVDAREDPIARCVSSAPTPSPVSPDRLKRTFPAIKIGVGVTAAALATAGAFYAGLKWYQRKSIRRVIKNHDLNLTDFSPTQKDAMAAAFRASYRVPGAIKRLGMLARKSEFISDTVSAETMWSILAEIYYKKSLTSQEVQVFKERVGR